MKDNCWRYIGASVIGTSHLAKGGKCQDTHAVFLTKDSTDEEILLIVAADGAGSAEKSDEGAELACDKFISIVDTYFKCGGTFIQINSDLLDTWINNIHESMLEKALASKRIIRDFACTFLALIVGEKSAIAAQIGDGAIVIRSDGAYKVVLWPQSGEYVNITFFITDDLFINYLNTIPIDSIVDEVAIFTDGIQMLALHNKTKTVFEPFLRPMFDTLRKEPSGKRANLIMSLEEYLGSPLINERTDDDKTLILATRYRD
ncbi:MAG TPA: PP2C family serine/threonine-protein phosphatase [Smithella sp.]|nr:PP2C family serine/threonine-protein phosphatase [Smithella sp.]